MVVDARLDIRLHPRHGRICGVSVLSGRRTDAAAFLVGKTATEALRILPVIFSLCGMSHSMAAVAAMEHALERTPHPTRLLARHRLVLCEAIADHGKTLGLGWPSGLSLPPCLDLVRQMQIFMRLAQSALFPQGDWASLETGPVASDHAAMIQAGLQVKAAFEDALGTSFPHILADPVGWSHTSPTPIAAMFRTAFQPDLADFAAMPVNPLTSDDLPHIQSALAADERGSFAARPCLSKSPYPETGPLARHHQHFALRHFAHSPKCGDTGQDGRVRYGLAARFLARLVDLETMLTLILAPSDDVSPPAGCVETSRGWLVHHATLEGQQISQYRIVAPTEWNFHPDRLQRVMDSVTVDDHLMEAMRWLLMAFDPCVPAECQLEEQACA